MRIVEEKSIREFEPWAGAIDVMKRLQELDLVDWVESFLEEGSFTSTQVNDFLWFDVPEIYEEEFGKEFFE